MSMAKDILTDLLILRKHLPNGEVSKQYVDEYNALLTAAQEKVDIDLERFFIRPNDLRREVAGASSNSLTGESSVWYYPPYCEASFFMLKLDGAISRIADKLGLDSPLD